MHSMRAGTQPSASLVSNTGPGTLQVLNKYLLSESAPLQALSTWPLMTLSPIPIPLTAATMVMTAIPADTTSIHPVGAQAIL